MGLIDEIREHVVIGHPDAESQYPPDMQGQPGVKEKVQQALDDGIEVGKILKQGLIAGMDVVGERFSNGEYFVPEMLLSAQAMKGGMRLLEPFLGEDASEKVGVVIMGTVKGDMHDIGKNLVSMMLEGGGFEVVDLGTNTPPEKFVEAAREYPEAIIGMSALLTTTREMMRTTLETLRSNDLNNKVIIGGAATSQTFADEIQADGFSRDAAKAVPLVKQLMEIAA